MSLSFDNWRRSSKQFFTANAYSRSAAFFCKERKNDRRFTLFLGLSGTLIIFLFAVPAAKAVNAVDDVYSTNARSQSVSSALSIAAPGVIFNDDAEKGGTQCDLWEVDVPTVTSPTKGTIEFLKYGDKFEGSFTYTPNANFSGQDSLTYRLTQSCALLGEGGFDDPSGDSKPYYSNTANVRINVTPVANDDSYSLAKQCSQLRVPSSSGLTANDYGTPSDLFVEITTGPSHGTVTLGADNTGVGGFVYKASGGFKGEDSFKYRVYSRLPDGSALAGNEATVRINVPDGGKNTSKASKVVKLIKAAVVKHVKKATAVKQVKKATVIKQVVKHLMQKVDSRKAKPGLR